jgi:pSer/pThr/pTyr-binding forkhead associated (FHA) protein
VYVDSSKVSRRHARILVTGNRAVLEDLGSKNGTYVRGRRIDAPTPLKDGDEIRVGSAGIVFHVFSGRTSTRTDTG